MLKCNTDTPDEDGDALRLQPPRRRACQYTIEILLVGVSMAEGLAHQRVKHANVQ